MKKTLILCLTWQVFIGLSQQVAVPDGKVIDGYGPDFADHQLDPEEAEFEHQQINRLPLEDGRSKRHVKYEVLESPGLHSHFQVIQDEEVLRTNPNRRRNRRSVEGRSELHSDEVEDVDTEPRRSGNRDDVSVEEVPLAEKQTMNPAYYRADDSRLMDKWVKAPYGDFQSRSQKDEEDTQSEASSNVGIKARTPRVNFITQQGQAGSANKDEPDGPEARERERERERERDRDRDRDQPSNTNKQSTDESFRKPTNERYYPSNYPPSKTYDSRPQSPSYMPSYDPYYRDPYREREQMPAPAYYPYNERDLMYRDRPPAGMSRMTPPLGASSSFYYRHQYNDYDDYVPRTVPNYYYSDKRFDAPALGGMPLEPRDPYERDLYRPYIYTNDVNNRPGRIIYYANLPEIVRNPGNYRSATARYGDPMYNNYYYNNNNYDEYRGSRAAKAVPFREPLPPTTTMRISSSPVRSETARDRSYY